MKILCYFCLILFAGSVLFPNHTLLAVEKGSTSPVLVGRYMDGSGYYSISMEKDKKRVFNIFSVQCIPCEKEIPELIDALKNFPETPLFLVNSWGERPESIERFLAGIKAGKSRVLIATEITRGRFKRPQDDDLLQPTTVIIGPGNKVLLVEYGLCLS